MKGALRFLWLEGIFDEKTVGAFPAVSAASNFWQKGFVEALQRRGHHVDVTGYPAERVWPFGRLVIGQRLASISHGLRGKSVGYINLPYLRDVFQYRSLTKQVEAHLQDSGLPDYQVVFSCLEKVGDQTAAIRVAMQIRQRYAVPWICIVADGVAPPGADAYVYLPWSHYESASAQGGAPVIHIDGGVPEAAAAPETPSADAGERALMYMGALTQHGGALELARAFTRVQGQDLRLWICGRGHNPELERVARQDARIVLKGFLQESELAKLAARAYGFANPRPAAFAPNQLNYPSKLLHYLAYGKPVISTLTPGVSPDYRGVLLVARDESQKALSQAIEALFAMDQGEYVRMSQRIARFRETHSWDFQVGRCLSWLGEELASSSQERRA